MRNQLALRFPTDPLSKLLAAAAVLLAAALLISASGCTVSREKKEGEAEKVEITTPVGSMEVRKEAEPQDIGLNVYPGAQRAQDEEDERAGARVNIQTSVFGLKVVAVKFNSEDAPDKVAGFYRKELARYGKVIECPNGIDMGVERQKGELEQEVRCEEKPDRDRKKGQLDLAVGSAERHRLVAIKPKGKGTEFALVYVQTRGERGTL